MLKKAPYREHDRQYVLYGRRHGLLLVAARGAAKSRSKQTPQLEPFSLSEVMIAKGRGLDHLAVATRSYVQRHTSNVQRPNSGAESQLPSTVCSLQSHVGRITRLSGLAVAGAFADLCLKLIRPGVADERLFDLWVELMACLSGLPQDLSVLRAQLVFGAASLKLMDALGYGPALTVRCGVCHQPIGPTDAWYVPNANSLVCAECISGIKEPALPAMAHALTLLRFMRTASLDDVLRVSLQQDIALNALRLIREVWQHAPLDREPHGMETIQGMLAV